MRLFTIFIVGAAASYSGDDDYSSGPSSSSSSSSGAPGNCDACQFIEGFAQSYLQGQMTCGSELTDFEGGAQDILNGLRGMVGSSPPSSNGWSDISSGFSEIENGLSSCAEQSWWSDMESDVEDVFEDLVPEVKLVADAYEIIVNGENIYDDLKSAYSDCSGGSWYSCGEDMGSLVSTLKSSGVLIASNTGASNNPTDNGNSMVGPLVGGVVGAMAVAGLAFGAKRYVDHQQALDTNAANNLHIALASDEMDYAKL